MASIRNDSAYLLLKRRLAARTPTTTWEIANPAAADIDAIKVAIATVASITTYSGAQLNGVIGALELNPPRNITVTTAGATAASAPATLLITGLDVNGAVQTETLNVGQTAVTVAGVKAFSFVTSLTFSAADDVDATVAVGFGALMGFITKPAVRQAAVHITNEMVAGARVTTGTFATPTTSPPNGTYSPSSAADGTRDYVVDFEPFNDLARLS